MRRKKPTEMQPVERKTVSPRIDPATRDWLATNFATMGSGAEWALEWAAYVLARALYSIKGRFERGELCALLDMHNGHYLAPRMSGPDHLALMIRDSEPDGLPEKWGYETKALIAKMEALTHPEAAALALWACTFWTTGIYEKDGSLEEYVGMLTGESS